MLTKFYFDYHEFLIENKDCGSIILDKLYRYWILPLSRIREQYGKPICVSERSGYRSKTYEISRGRSGNSPHCFDDEGAVDLIWSPILQDIIYRSCEFPRIIVYRNRGFMHIDYKKTLGFKTVVYYTVDDAKSIHFVAGIKD